MGDLAAVSQSPAEQKYTPTIFIDLTKSDIKELSGVKVGDNVRVVITGKVKSVATREDAGDKTGSISLESKDVVINPAPDNVFDDLADD